MNARRNRPSPFVTLGIPAVLVAAVFACFWPALSADFLASWDDDHVILNNPRFRGLSGENLGWMLTTFKMGHYHPLTWISLGLDYELWGMRPLGYHLTNVALHAANAVLVLLLADVVFRIARASAAGRISASLLAASLFALHPLRVESVAWVTERRDVLSTFFLLATVLAWLRSRITAGERRRTWWRLSVLLFLLSLGSKAWGITLPAVLLLLDAWPLGRFSRGSDAYTPLPALLREKAPFLALALVAAILAWIAQRSTGAMEEAADFTPLQTLAQAAFGTCFYVWKTLLPIHLVPVYELDKQLEPLSPLYVSCAAAVFVGFAALALLRRRWPAGLAAFACYAIVVSPVLGFAQSGVQMAADRYSYVACIPFALLVAAGFARLDPTGRVGKLAAAAAVLVVGLLGLRTWRLTHVWRDSLTLWTYALEVEPENGFVLNQRGSEHREAGEHRRALADFEAAVRACGSHLSFKNRGITRMHLGDKEGAIRDWTRAIELNPECAVVYTNRGGLLLERGDTGGALADFRNAVRIEPDHGLALYNLAVAQQRAGLIEDAIESLRRALAHAPQGSDVARSSEQLMGKLLDGRGSTR